ncbi:MAG: tetratricopeptide repeat protein, partial [Rhodanobacter sp.]
ALAYNNRALVYHLKGQNANGLSDAEKAVALAPNDAAFIQTRAQVYEQLGQRDKAIADYRAALKLAPDMKLAQDGLGRLRAAH